MSRRDTIIVAVLINAALLTLLFMTAVNVDETATYTESDEMIVKAEPQVHEPIESTKPQNQPEIKTGGDELDIVLKEFTEKVKETPNLAKVEKPQPVVPKKQTPKKEYIEVTVKHGDFLGKIARDNGTTVSEIMKLNHLSSERIDVGQVLRMPKKVNTKVVQKIEQKKKENDPHYYIVQKGDNPWKIAKKFHVGFNELLSLNHLDEDRARALKPGDKLRVN